MHTDDLQATSDATAASIAANRARQAARFVRQRRKWANRGRWTCDEAAHRAVNHSRLALDAARQRSAAEARRHWLAAEHNADVAEAVAHGVA